MSEPTSQSYGESQTLLTKKPPTYTPPSGGIFEVLPAAWVPYAELMRLDRPAGFFAFYWHYLIGIGFGVAVLRPALDPGSLALVAIYLAIWVVVLRGAVCTVNDNLDQDFDRKVARTQCRPIARGAVSTHQANIFALLQFALLAVMILQCPIPHASRTAGAYAALSAAILTVYPLGKRVTDFPQLILGVGFAAAIPFSSAVVGVDPFDIGGDDLHRRWAVLSLCVASGIWTVIFDTVYAHQDRQDDIKAGVRGLAVRLGDYTKLVLSISAVTQVVLLAAVGGLIRLSWVYFAGSCAGVALALAAMLILVDLDSPASCAWWFGQGTAIVGTTMVAGFLGEYVIRQLGVQV